MVNKPEARALCINDRREFLKSAFVASTSTAIYSGLAAGRELRSYPAEPFAAAFELEELTFSELQEGMKSGKFTARSITEKYLVRIEALDKQGPAINSVIELN